MTVQTGRPSKNKKVGLCYIVPLPVYMLYSVQRMRMKHPELLSPYESKTKTAKTSLYPVYAKNLEEEKSKLTNAGVKIEARKMNAKLPIFCPVCEREGTPEFNQDTRICMDAKAPTFRIYYNHNSNPKRCYVGTWMNGQTRPKQGIHPRKMNEGYWIVRTRIIE